MYSWASVFQNIFPIVQGDGWRHGSIHGFLMESGDSVPVHGMVLTLRPTTHHPDVSVDRFGLMDQVFIPPEARSASRINDRLLKSSSGVA
jgi:hypothetical protein